MQLFAFFAFHIYFWPYIFAHYGNKNLYIQCENRPLISCSTELHGILGHPISYQQARNYRRKSSLLVSGKQVDFSTTTKYLGVHLDHKLLWTTHITQALKKAKAYLFMILKNVNTRFGPKANLTKWVYISIVRPRILYAYYVWGHKASKTETLQALQRLNNLACKMITPFFLGGSVRRQREQELSPWFSHPFGAFTAFAARPSSTDRLFLPHLGRGHRSPGLPSVPSHSVCSHPGRASLSRRHW